MNATTEGLTKGLWLHHWKALDDVDDVLYGDGEGKSAFAAGTSQQDGATSNGVGGVAGAGNTREAAAATGDVNARCAAKENGSASSPECTNKFMKQSSVASPAAAATLLLDSEGLGAPGGDLRGYDSKLVRSKSGAIYETTLVL